MFICLKNKTRFIILILATVTSTYTIAQSTSTNTQEQGFSYSNNADEHCYVLGNNAHKIMSRRQDGESATNLVNQIQKLDVKYNKNELFELVDKAYQIPMSQHIMQQMVVVSNFMSDIEQKCMQDEYAAR